MIFPIGSRGAPVLGVMWLIGVGVGIAGCAGSFNRDSAKNTGLKMPVMNCKADAAESRAVPQAAGCRGAGSRQRQSNGKALHR